MMGTILDVVLDRSIVFSFDRSGFVRHGILAQLVATDGRALLVAGLRNFQNLVAGFSARRHRHLDRIRVYRTNCTDDGRSEHRDCR